MRLTDEQKQEAEIISAHNRLDIQSKHIRALTNTLENHKKRIIEVRRAVSLALILGVIAIIIAVIC